MSKAFAPAEEFSATVKASSLSDKRAWGVLLAESSPGSKKGARDYFWALRPWSFSMTIISVVTGSIMGLLLQGKFSPNLALLVLVGMIAIHGATNIFNDLFDTIYGADRPGAPTTLYRRHPILTGIFSPREILVFSMVLYGITVLISVYLVGIRGWTIAALTIAGAFASVAYSARPIRFKYRGWGEISAFFVWGPLMIFGSYFVQTGVYEGTAEVLFISLPLGMLVAAVLLANNLKDLSYDSELKIMTLVVRLGRTKSIQFFSRLLYCVYLWNSLGILLGYLSWWTLLVYLSLPLALKLIFNFNSQAEIPPDADPKTARLTTVFGLLFILSLIAGHFFPFT